MTSMLCLLYAEFLLQVLCKSTWFVGIWVIQGYEGMGDIPGIQVVLGGSVCSAASARLTQELRPKV